VGYGYSVAFSAQGVKKLKKRASSVGCWVTARQSINSRLVEAPASQELLDEVRKQY
jgi:hypothetical protein